MRYLVTLSVVLSILLINITFSGTTGKIAGTVVDAKTGEKLISANVQVVGQTIGAATNIDGYFAILNVPPGLYTVQATLLGYTANKFVSVSVAIDQTTTLNFRLSDAAVEQEEVTVVAQRPVVQRDVAQSVANITEAEIKSLPIASVTGVVTLQAGVQTNAAGDLVVRGSGGTSAFGGGGSDQVLFVLDGQTLRDGRDNSPYTAISLSSLENIQVVTGGFSAEYSNVRSGLVNVVTKEGNPSKYNVSMSGRYSPADPKHFGPSAYDPNSYFIRPYVDPDVAWTGTGSGYQAGAWDKWTRDQYSQFEGWNSISQKTLQDNDPTNDLTPEAAQRLFLWQHRRQAEISQPDYDIDAGFGGPLIPGLSEDLGNLRFFGAYRRSKSAYLIPLSRDAFEDEIFQLKITSDIAEGMKLSIEGLSSVASGTNNNNAGLQGIYRGASSIATNLNRVSFIDTRIFAPDYWAPATERRRMAGLRFTHMLSPSTFYNFVFTGFQTRYNTAPGTLRNNARVYKFGNSYYVDEAPFGFQPVPLTGNYTSIEGIGPTPAFRMGVGMSNSRDQSITSTLSGKIDFTSQLDQYNNLQAGGEFTYIESKLDYGNVDIYLPSGRTFSQYRKFPQSGGAYVQDKLEFEGMVANLGLRMDYSYGGGEWYQYDVYSKILNDARSYGIDTLLSRIPVERKFNFSPRLGIAFPISEDSKVFFNYGHYRALPTLDDLYLIRRDRNTGAITFFADPNVPLARTIQYELGYEHNLFDQLLLRVAGYYKDITNESKTVEYFNGTGGDLTLSRPNRYRDIRGAELTVSKNRGNWIQGFINYTYDVRSTGFFGYEQNYKNPGEQRNYEQIADDFLQSKPKPQPFARANITLFTPSDIGPGSDGLSLLGDWRLNLLGSWSTGRYFTWAGGGSVRGVIDNVQWKDAFNIDLRISKTLKVGGVSLEMFADMTNLFNIRRLSEFGFFSTSDYNSYMLSLHLPGDIAGDPSNPKLAYPNIPGEDKPGDYRKEGVTYQPIVVVSKFTDLGSGIQNQQARPYYYVTERGKYFQMVNGVFQEVDGGKVQQVLDDKAYIDMPNMDTFNFLNPRNIFYGLRLSFDL